MRELELADVHCRYKTQTAWVYESGGEEANFASSGTFWTYRGDGYGAELAVNIDRSNRTVQELKELLWLDRRTRATFLEFILFNPNANVFQFVSMRVEFALTGLAKTDVSDTVIRLYATGFNAIYVKVVEIAFVVLLLANAGVFVFLATAMSPRDLWRQIRSYLDVLLFVAGVAMIAVYVLRYIITQNLVTQIKGSVIHFLPFQRAVFYHKLFIYLLALITSLAVLKFVVILRLSERFAKFGAMLKASFIDIASVGILYFLVIVAYSMLCTVAFRNHYVFSSFIQSVEMLFAMSLGEFRRMEQFLANPTVIVQLFVMTYSIFSNIVMLNILIAVIVEAHEEFRKKTTLRPTDHELVQEMARQVETGVKKSLDQYTKMSGF